MEAFQSGFALALLQELLERFKSLAIDEAGQAVHFDAEQELKKLQGKLFNAQTLLDGCQVMPNKAWQHWVGDVTTVCYDAEDLVDDIMLGATRSSVIEKILSYFTRGNMARKIQDLQDRLEDIVRGLEMIVKTRQFQSEQYSVGCLKGSVCGMQQILPPEKLFGRSEDKERIVTMLLKKTVSSVSIVGMDGLGKTALAQYVHHDSRIRDGFNHVLWVSVSAKFDLAKITESIWLQNQGLFQELYLNESILIVLDDLRDVTYSDWSLFRSRFLRSSGCKVLLTTCNPNVALVTKATPYYLQKMRDEDCRALIMDRAISFNNLSERQHVILEEIAGTVAQKCKGLPLAANILGLQLSSKPSEDDWRILSERDICNMRVFRDEIFPVFKLNNPDLASHLKKCLAYCSLFPYNYDFKRDNLVQLWMAEGFILAHGTTSRDADIGNDYFDELLMRSIFQLSDFGDHEEPTYKMHEFIHRFAEFVASDTCSRLEEGKLSSSAPLYKRARHLSLLYHTIQMVFLKDIEKCEGLRSFHLLSEHGTKIGQVPYSFFQKLHRLRVLDLSHTDLDELPESLGRLKYLRYLDVSKTHILRLPESTSSLHKLNVLKLRDCGELLELPKNTKQLTNLVHLDVDMKGLRCMPASIGSLSNLQTLSAFVVRKREGHRVTELKNLKFLRGTICLSGLGNVQDGVWPRKHHYLRSHLLRDWSWNGTITLEMDRLL